MAVILVLQTGNSTKTCELVRRERKTSDECFSESECMDRCGVLKGENCRIQQEKQCNIMNEKQCTVVEEQVGQIKFRPGGNVCKFSRNVERRQKIFVKQQMKNCVMLVKIFVFIIWYYCYFCS